MENFSKRTQGEPDSAGVTVKKASISAASVGLIILSLSACGGGTAAKQMPGAESDLIPAAGTDSTVNVTTPDSSSGGTTQPVPPLVDVPNLIDTGDTTQEPTTTIAYSENQELISAAGNVGCEADPEIFRDTMLEMINASRSELRMCGDMQRPPVKLLQWNNTLTQTAVAHADDMTINNFFSHDGSDGLSVSHRADAAGYPWRAVGENIAAGQLDIAEVHQGWLDSAGHCVNIMNDLFTEVGAACVRNPRTDFGTYWVVVFGDSK